MERVMSKTQQELLDNTVSYYNLNNRGIDPSGGRCRYYVKETGISCAIGRELSESTAEILEKKCSGKSATMLSVQSHLPLRLQKMEMFLDEIQILHDADVYWTVYGLSKDGIKCCKLICKKYSLEKNYKKITEKRKQEYFNKSKNN